MQLGNVAVASFFVLSGYLMNEAMTSFYHHRPFAFILNRYLRITPPLLVAVIVSISLHALLITNIDAQILSTQFPITNISHDNVAPALASAIFPFNGILLAIIGGPNNIEYDFVRYSWAIFTELLFYWYMFLNGILKKICSHNSVSLLLYLGSLAISLTGIVVYNSDTIGLPDNVLRFTKAVPFIFHFQWAPHFLLGVMISLFNRQKKTPVVLIRTIIALLFSLLQLGLYASHSPNGAPILVLCLYGIVVLGIIHISKLQPNKDSRWGHLSKYWDKFLGNFSYPVYINHFSISITIITILLSLEWDISNSEYYIRIPLYLLFCTSIVLIAGLLIQLTDKLTDTIRNRIRKHIFVVNR